MRANCSPAPLAALVPSVTRTGGSSPSPSTGPIRLRPRYPPRYVFPYHRQREAASIEIQDGPEPHDYVVHEIFGAERDLWWERGAAVYPGTFSIWSAYSRR